MANTTPTFGWICTDLRLLAMAEAILDEGYDHPLAKPGDTNMYRLGRIGSLYVVMTCLQEPFRAADAAQIAQDMAAIFNGIKAILMTGFGGAVPSAGIKLGDLFISPTIIRYDIGAESSSTPTPNIVQRAVHVLQREVGADGRWLSSDLDLALSNFPELLHFTQRPHSDPPDYPLLHYGNIDSERLDTQNVDLLNRLPAVKNILCFDMAAPDLTNFPIATIAILGVSNYEDSRESDIWKKYAAANAALYAKEFIQVMMNDLNNSVPDLEDTEQIIPPHMDPKLPPFQPHQYPSHGNAVLLVIPTENESKTRLLEEAFRERAPNGVIVHTLAVPVESGVGEQPYNEAGLIGAHNRVSNALLRFDAVEYQETFKEKRIGHVIVASIENFIQTDNIDRPTDYGVVVMHNVNTQQTTVGLSWGVTVPPVYVNRARRFGFEGDPNRGRVTVGQILAANVPGLDKADWQAVLARHSRYDLLKDAIRQLPIPW